MSNPRSTLGAAADDRKARLAKLKSLKRKQPEEDHHENDTAAAASAPEPDAEAPPEKDVARLHLSGRNYDPETRGPKLGFEAPPTLGVDRTLEQQAAEVEDEVRLAAAEDETDKAIDLFKLQPKKPNWDLKRELNQKLEILNARTDNAIARLVRERLAAKAVAQTPKAVADGEENGTGLEGAALVEGIRVREREELEEGRREREEDDFA